MKKVFLPLILGLVLGACSRDNDENLANNGTGNNTNETPVLVTKIKYSGTTNGSAEIVYDGDKIKEIRENDKDDGNKVTIFNYEGDLIKSATMNIENRAPITKTYTYKGDKLILVEEVVERDYYLGGKMKKVERHDYTYNGDGTIVVNKTINGTHSSDSKYNYTHKKVLTYTIKNNLITKVVEIDGDTTMTTTLEYDGKNSPYKNIKGLSNLLIEAYEEFESFPQNISKYEYRHDFASGTPSTISLNKYTYTYNGQGYPTKVVHDRDENGVKENYIREYTYNR